MFAFWAKSSIDAEPRRIRLKSNSYTTNNILDTVTAATFQVGDVVLLFAVSWLSFLLNFWVLNMLGIGRLLLLNVLNANALLLSLKVNFQSSKAFWYCFELVHEMPR